MMSGLNRSLAGATLVMVGVAAALPWGLPPDWRFLLPQLPFLVLHFWTVRDARLISVWLVLALGVMIDVVTGGPLGYWSLTYLTGFALTAASWGLPLDTRLGRWGHLAVTTGLLNVLAWLLASLYFFEIASPWPFGRAAIAAVFVYPVIALLLAPLTERQAPSANPSLIRGR